MEITLILISIILALFYIFSPISKSEKDNFKNMNNWRGGF